MTKHLDCVVDGCDASIEAESDEAVMARVESHVQQEHPDLDLDDETVELVRSNIRSV
jgi:predicted small metal-binding protein